MGSINNSPESLRKNTIGDCAVPKKLEAFFRLNPQAQAFFVKYVARLSLADSKVGYRILTRLPRGYERRAAVRLLVLSEDGESVFTLHYKDVTRVEVNFPGKRVLFQSACTHNFGDWGY